MQESDLSREQIAHAALAAPALTPSGLRPMSAGSLALLQLAGSPVYKLLFHGTEEQLESLDILTFAFIHTADPEQLRRLAPDKAALLSAVLAWAESLPPSAPAAFASELATQIREVASQFSKVLPPDKPEKSKNGHGQPC